jgi:hypothetical protein
MQELTTIGDYEVRVLERTGAVVRYVATHVVLPRRAVIELLDVDAPRVEAVKLMRRACILEALQHPAVPRVFECGRLHGQPWVAIADEQGTTLHDELQQRRLGVREALTLLEEMAAVLSHAHARGVLHGNITARTIVRAPTLMLQRWENARVHDTDLSSEVIDMCDDVFDLGKTISAALAKPDAAPKTVTRLLSRMLATDPAMRPTAPELATAARSIRDAIGSIDEVDVDQLFQALAVDVESDDQEPILLDRPRVGFQTVIVDLDACL